MLLNEEDEQERVASRRNVRKSKKRKMLAYNDEKDENANKEYAYFEI